MTQYVGGEFRGKRYVPGRHVTTPADFFAELQAVSRATTGRIEYRGTFDTDTVDNMRPPPVPGDLWVYYDKATEKYWMYLQVDDRPRRRVKWEVTLEDA